MIKVNLRNKLAVGKHRNFIAHSSIKAKKSVSPPAIAQEGQGFKSLKTTNSKINIEPNKKLDKFINFKL